jgi:hypothetical protein
MKNLRENQKEPSARMPALRRKKLGRGARHRR